MFREGNVCVPCAEDASSKLELLQPGLQNLKEWAGTSLVVQWLRLRTPNARGPGSIPGQGTRFHMPQLKIPHAATKDPARGKEDPACGN